MSGLLEQPLAALIDAPVKAGSDLAEALTVRMASLTFSIGASSGRSEILRVLAASSPAQFVGAFIELLAAQQPHDVRGLLVLRGRAEILNALESSGGMWRADEAQAHLKVGRATLQNWRRDRTILALPLPDGSFGYPVAQFARPASDLQKPRPYPVLQSILQTVGERLTAEEVFLLLATPQESLAGAEGIARTAFACMESGENELVGAFVAHAIGSDDEGAPAVED